MIRNDNGQNVPAQQFGCNLSYKVILLGTDPAIPVDCKLPAQYRLDVTTASDDAIVEDMAQMLGQYLDGLLFQQDDNGRYIGSPYDVFLRVNHLPVLPIAGQTVPEYNAKLLQLVNNLEQSDLCGWYFGQLQISRAAVCIWRDGIRRAENFSIGSGECHRWLATRRKLRRLPHGPEFHRLQISQ